MADDAAVLRVVRAVLARVSALYAKSQSLPYDPPPAGSEEMHANDALDLGVGFMSHSLQAAALASAKTQDPEVILAALLHDIGWLCPKPSDEALLTREDAASADAEFLARHDIVGAAFLSRLGFPARVCRLVAGHVQAKRYLCATEPEYAANLSQGSAYTLTKQGGPMSPAEVAAFERSPDWRLVVALRRWDEEAKLVGGIPGMRGWDDYADDLARMLAGSLFAPSGAPWLGPELAPLAVLAASGVAPGSDPLGPAGPGFVVLRGLLSAVEVEALQAFAGEWLPARTPEADGVIATYEAAAQTGAKVLSRTERFAHLHDPWGVGRFLMHGRLADVISLLRGGRPQSLYKEKVNYKMAGGCVSHALRAGGRNGRRPGPARAHRRALAVRAHHAPQP